MIVYVNSSVPRFLSPLQFHYLDHVIVVRLLTNLSMFFSVIPVSRSEIKITSATQSGAAPCCPINRATDRDLLTVSLSNSPDINNWVDLKLAESRTIDRVVFYYRFFNNWPTTDNACYKDQNKWIMCLKSHSDVTIWITQGDEVVNICGMVELNTRGFNKADQVYSIACGVKGDGVSLTSTDSRILVAEIVVHGTIYEPEGNVLFPFSLMVFIISFRH